MVRRMSVLGQKRTNYSVFGATAVRFSPKADKPERGWIVRFVPLGDKSECVPAGDL